MSVYQELKKLGFEEQFRECLDGHVFSIHMKSDSVFLWGELEENRMQLLYAGRSGDYPLENSKYYKVIVSQRYFDHTHGAVSGNDSVFTCAVDGDLCRALSSKFLQEVIGTATPITDTPGVIDAFMLPTFTKTAIREAAIQRAGVVPEETAGSIATQYESRELYSMQGQYLKRYPEKLRRALDIYYKDLQHQVEVYSNIYDKATQIAVQALLD